jgi:hypothetical protein
MLRFALRSLVPARAIPAVVAAIAIGLAPHVARAQVEQPPPVIERLEPTSGPPGTTVQMVGRFFRPDQIVRLGTVPVEVLSRMPNRWTIRIPQGAASARIGIEVPRVVQVFGPDFRVLAAPPLPVISDLAPRSAAPGAEVRIAGENFSPRITENTVTLGNLPVVVRSATPTELLVIVPQGAQTGRFVVRVAGSGEGTAPIDLTIGTGVTIARFAPTIAAPGTRVQIDGTGFQQRTASNRVFIGSTPCRVISASPTTIVFEVPASASGGVLLVDVRGAGRAYSAQPLIVQAAPRIAAVEPPAAPPGAAIRIRGAGFGSDVRAVQVTIGGVASTVRGLTPTEITAEVPANATSGPIAVTVNGVGPATSARPFTISVPPAIADFQPRSGGPGTEVVITGRGFSSSIAENRVSLSNVGVDVLAASPTQLRVRIPQAASGPLTVTVLHAGEARTSQPFVLTTPPFVSRFDPERGPAGTAVTIHGTGFGTNPALVEATVGDRRMEIRSVADTRMEAVVPTTGATGRIRVTVRLQGSATSQREFMFLGDFSVTAIEPATAHPGQWVTIRGTGMTASGMQVRFPGVGQPIPYTFGSATAIRVVVPAGAQSGAISVRSQDGREVSSPPFTVSGPPEGVGIGSIDATCMRVGCRVIVRGWGFASHPAHNRVTIGTGRTRVRRATPYELELELPRTPGTMTIRIDVHRGGSVESQPITITP